jgi:hypothetical protein
MKKIGFLSFGHWTPSPQSQTRTASDALLQSIDLAVAAEELGADGAYFRVHHFARQLGSPFPLLAAIGAKTTRIEIGTAVIDMRYENPLYMAEDVGAADLIASGRLQLGISRGSLRGLRDRAMLLLGFAGGLRRSEIVGLDLGRDQTEDGRGWVEILDRGMVVALRGKNGWREVEIGRGSSDSTCPIVALQTWLKLARIGHGPLFRRVTGQGKDVGPERLNDREIARLVKRTALAAGVRGDLDEGEREEKSPATPCVPALPPLPRSTSATCRSSSGTRPPR